MSRNRAWCITINNFNASDWFAIKNLFKNASYAICGEEVGKQGTSHLQAYYHAPNPVSLAFMKKHLPRAHLTVANGSDQQNKDYCGKDGTNLYEIGEVSVGQGSRTDIKELAQKIKDREVTIEDCMFEYPELYVRYNRALEKMFEAVSVRRTVKPFVSWRWGLTGVGKTHYVVNIHGDENISYS